MINIKKTSIFASIVFLLLIMSGCKNQEETQAKEAIMDSAEGKTATAHEPIPLNTQESFFNILAISYF